MLLLLHAVEFVETSTTQSALKEELKVLLIFINYILQILKQKVNMFMNNITTRKSIKNDLGMILNKVCSLDNLVSNTLGNTEKLLNCSWSENFKFFSVSEIKEDILALVSSDEAPVSLGTFLLQLKISVETSFVLEMALMSQTCKVS